MDEQIQLTAAADEVIKTVDKIFAQETMNETQPTLTDIIRVLKEFQNDFTKAVEAYNNAYKDFVPTDENGNLKEVSTSTKNKLFARQEAGQNMISVLASGYIMLHHVRKRLVGDEITYSFIKEYSKQSVEYKLTIEELFKYARKKTFGFQSSENIAYLSLTMKGLTRVIADEQKKRVFTNADDTSLYQQVMSYHNRIFEKGSFVLNSRDTLAEVYEQLRNINFVFKRKNELTRAVIYFYKMTQGQIDGYQGNVSQLKSGDSFLTQVKYNAKKTESFILIDSKFLSNQLQNLIDTFQESSTVDELYQGLSKQFIQQVEVQKELKGFAKEYYDKITGQIKEEAEYLRKAIKNIKI